MPCCSLPYSDLRFDGNYIMSYSERIPGGTCFENKTGFVLNLPSLHCLWTRAVTRARAVDSGVGVRRAC